MCFWKSLNVSYRSGSFSEADLYSSTFAFVSFTRSRIKKLSFCAFLTFSDVKNGTFGRTNSVVANTACIR